MPKVLARVFIGIGLLVVALVGRDLSYVNGWQMKGFGGYDQGINVSSLMFSNIHIKYLWAYQDGVWRVSYIQSVNEQGPYPPILGIKNNEGFWIRTDNDGNISMFDVNFKTVLPITMHVKSGWHMYAYESDIAPISFNNPHIKMVWSYDRTLDKWMAYSQDQNTKILLDTLHVESMSKIKQNEGFWVYSDANTEQNITTLQAPHLEDTAMSVREGSIEDQSVGYVDFADQFSGHITGYTLLGENNDTFKMSSVGSLTISKPDDINFTSKPIYRFKVQAHSDKGDSNIANLYVYVSRKPQNIIVPSDTREYDFAGDVLKFSNDELFLGVYKADTNTNGYNHSDSGKVYRFTQLTSTSYKENSYQEEYPSTQDYFATSLAVAGGYITIGAPGRRDDYVKAGIVLVGKIKPDGSIERFTELYQNTDTISANHGFGQSVAMNDTNILVGSKSLGDSSIYWYKQNSYGNFVFKEQIKPSDDNNFTDFGYQIAVSGDYFAVSSPSKSKVYVYKFTSDSYQLIDILQKDNAFGYRLAMDGAYIAIGSIGIQKVYLYKIKDNNVEQIAQITPEISIYNAGSIGIFDAASGFGSTGLAIKGKKIAVGASMEKDDMVMSGDTTTGSVYLYEIGNDDNVSLTAKFRDPYLSGGASFGEGVSLSQNYLAVGATREAGDVNGTYVSATGTVYIYDLH